jgi:hypothetical protein
MLNRRIDAGLKNNMFINKHSNVEGTVHHYCVGYRKWGTPILTSDYNLFLCDEIDGITASDNTI